MNIGKIKQALKQANPNAVVYFDFGGCVPTTVASWRGVYSEPAIGWEGTSYSGGGKAPTAVGLLAELELATSGKIYQGWKGGDYRYDDNSDLHVDNRGCSTGTVIINVEVGEYEVVIHTRRND